MNGRPSGRTGAPSALERLRGRCAALVFGSVVTVTDLLPPRIRYGYVHRVSRAVLRRDLPALTADGSRATAALARPVAGGGDLTCVLATDTLDIGGIGSVVELLAERLGAWGVRPVVLCSAEGKRATRLRERGVDVVVAEDEEAAGAALGAAQAHAVQLHSAPPYVERAALGSGLPLVTVFHNTEIHFTRRRWSELTGIMSRSASGIAVSETVREFHVRHLPAELHDRIEVVPNGVPPVPADRDRRDREAARSRLAATVGADLTDAVVLVSLVRYDAQKNISGTVATFLHAAQRLDRVVHLVLAGAPSDWAELRRADGIRRSSPLGHRVHLLGNSDAQMLLAAGDAFILNSFFEGWAVAATEAGAAGLPLLLSDVGGAAELVSLAPHRSFLVPNPSGAAGAVSDARVAAARRRSRRQSNREELTDALQTVVDVVLHERGDNGDGAAATPPPSVDDMARGHARLIASAAATAPRLR